MSVRPEDILHQLPVTEWTEEEGFVHLRETFDLTCMDFPDVMESHALRISDLTDRQEIKAFMRTALRETFGQRRHVRVGQPPQYEAAE